MFYNKLCFTKKLQFLTLISLMLMDVLSTVVYCFIFISVVHEPGCFLLYYLITKTKCKYSSEYVVDKEFRMILRIAISEQQINKE